MEYQFCYWVTLKTCPHLKSCCSIYWCGDISVNVDTFVDTSEDVRIDSACVI